MERALFPAIVAAMFSFVLMINLGFRGTIILDEQYDLIGKSDENFFRNFYFNMTRGDSVSINISVTGNAISFYIFSFNGTQLLQRSVTASFHERWVVPHSDTFEFYTAVPGNGNSLVHLEVALGARLTTDLNYDGAVNMSDVGIVARAFGLKLGEPNWDPVADLDGNGVVNMKDVGMVARDFGRLS